MTGAGTTVVVAGGTSGINLAIARAYAARGAQVAVLSRSQQKVDDAVARLSGQTTARGYAADVRDGEAVLWLTSPRASYITGAVLSVDGGLALGGSSAIAAAMRA
ncbi:MULTISPECIES: SDR family NAD(P)-dependent oxidoreductase [Protofrankia]|uniref:SDR family NAD(P)-dependent oxidoreductase n=1 Tax=Protofrankia TaxID=2994361 RepID=UPI0001C537F3|nr:MULTISPECIES: SDR family NAD(P)-dependent oxidoreductase [Protofrankia]